jgi:mannose-6-phosphate isomerase-like protein (cupin superfamily)
MTARDVADVVYFDNVYDAPALDTEEKQKANLHPDQMVVHRKKTPKILLYKSDVAEFSLARVSPGDQPKRHHHTEIWDFFLGIGGQGAIKVWDESGECTAYPLPPESFLAVPPNTSHQVTNTSDTETFAFVLMHVPYDGFNYVRED